MNIRTTTYNYQHQLESALGGMRKDPGLKPETRESILGFHRSLVAAGLGHARQVKYVNTLRLIFSGAEKPAEQWTSDYVGDFVRKIEGRPYTAWTKHDYRVVLRRFLRWVHGGKDPPGIESLQSGRRLTASRLPDVLSEEEVGRMIAGCVNPRDAAFLASLYETGCRPDELGSLKLRNVQPDRYGFVLVVSGKTGMRRVRVCLFAHHLAAWLDRHPRRRDPDAVLWPGQKNNECRIPMSNGGLARVVQHAARRVGLGKRAYLYLFRHSRATYLASRLTEAQMNVVFGWKQGSSMPGTYVHLSGRDVDGALLQIAGVAPKEANPNESALKPRDCLRCGLSNPGTSGFCQRCAAPMDAAEVYKVQDESDVAGKMIAELLRDDPALKAILKQRIKKKLMEGQSPMFGNV